MGIFSKRLEQRDINGYSNEEFLRLLGITSNTGADNHRVSEITYFSCLKILSESVGKLPLQLYRDKNDSSTLDTKHYLNAVLRRPNPHMTPFQFWSTLELQTNHYGNGYAYIHTVNGKVQSLHILDSERVQVWIDDAGLWGDINSVWYVYSDPKGNQYRLSADQVIHHKTSVSFNGITGLSELSPYNCVN